MAERTGNKIKIAYILPTLDKGGAERFLCDLILNLNREHFDPLLILFKRGGEWLEELKTAGVPFVLLEKKHKFDLGNFFKIFSAIREFKPDIVHTQLGGDIYGRLAAKILNISVIISTEQNVNPDENFFFSLLKRLGNSWSNKIIAISQSVKDDIINRYKTPATKITIINNGVALDKFIRGESDITRNEAMKRGYLVFGTIGRLSEQKGHSILIEAWSKLKNQNCRCFIVGAGHLKAELDGQIKNLGLSDHVKLIGLTSDVPSFLKSLDAFVLPSLWEGQGLVLAEAALARLPIIASAVDGIKETFDESNAWLVPPSEPQLLADKIDNLIDNINSPRTMEKINLAQKIALTKFDIKDVADRYESLYNSLLE